MEAQNALAPSLLDWLQEFYASECDNSEDGMGFTISTLDHSGWSLDFDLEGTPLEGKTFTAVKIEREEHDWLQCRVENDLFQGRGGPKNLTEMLTTFRNWAEATISRT